MLCWYFYTFEMLAFSMIGLSMCSSLGKTQWAFLIGKMDSHGCQLQICFSQQIYVSTRSHYNQQHIWCLLICWCTTLLTLGACIRRVIQHQSKLLIVYNRYIQAYCFCLFFCFLLTLTTARSGTSVCSEWIEWIEWIESELAVMLTKIKYNSIGSIE